MNAETKIRKKGLVRSFLWIDLNQWDVQRDNIAVAPIRRAFLCKLCDLVDRLVVQDAMAVSVTTASMNEMNAAIVVGPVVRSLVACALRFVHCSRPRVFVTAPLQQRLAMCPIVPRGFSSRRTSPVR